MAEIEKLVIATHNTSKVDRYEIVFKGLVSKIIGIDDKEFEKIEVGKPEETGSSAEENAKIKAMYYAKRLGFLVFSEDESLFVDFLPESEQPGVFVRRINGKDDATDSELLKYWAKIIKDVPEEKRTGKWHIAYCLATPDGRTFSSSRDHLIQFYYPPSVIRWSGWPMSSLQGRRGFGKPQTDFTPEEKARDQESGNMAIREKLMELIRNLELK